MKKQPPRTFSARVESIGGRIWKVGSWTRKMSSRENVRQISIAATLLSVKILYLSPAQALVAQKVRS